MATYGDCEKAGVKYDGQFTYGQLEQLTLDQLIILSKSQAQELSKKDAVVGKAATDFLVQVLAGLTVNAISNIDWQSILAHFILMIRNLL